MSSSSAPVVDTAVQELTPWEAPDVVDYDKLLREFGCEAISEELILRCEKLTGKPAHRFLRRGVFFSHRDLSRVLDLYERGQPFYLYTGRGPSSQSMHTGHLVPFLFTKWLQETFNVPLVIQITDDEKFYFKEYLTIDEIDVLAHENIRDIIALGFDMEKTFIFRDFEYIGHLYRTVARIEKATTANQVRGCFGFKGEDNVGKWMFPAIQAAPAFSVCFPHIFPPVQPKEEDLKKAEEDAKKKKVKKGAAPVVEIPKGPIHRNVYCLIPQAIDQDPYFRLTRDIAPRLGFLKPALIHSKFFPGLAGSGGKMSSSVAAANTTAIFLTDTEKQIKDKINKHAFSGGGATKEEQLELGAFAPVDVPVQWLSFFLEDDVALADIQQEYSLGRIMTGQVKKMLIDILKDIVIGHQKARENVSDANIAQFCAVRDMSRPEWTQ